MKKIININLSGRVIPIEDSAYEQLKGYIESLRRHFANEEGREEIINDIESRIAELMNEKVRKGADCINDADVEEIAASMGRPEDFEEERIEASDSSKPNTEQDFVNSENKEKRRLYRDSSDKFIGGVCSGIANYLNTDPAIVRILFAIVTFGGFGLGFLIYILLWIVLPTKDLENFSGKRLYRNPDDRVIGGVAGGLSAYFNIRTSTIRFIFAAPLIFSIFFGVLRRMAWHNNFDFYPNILFGSISGTFIIAYIILWMVLPEARSTYEKMEMRGEKVDVNSIRQNVREGMENVKEKVKGWSGEVKASTKNFSNKAKEFASTKGKAFATEVSETARRSGHGIGHAIGVLFKVFFLFIAGTIAFALFVALIALIFGGIAWWPINNFLWTSKWQQLYAWGTLIFFFGVPLIAFITWLIRRILRVRSRSSYLGWTFGGLWIIGWVSGILFAASITNDLREYESSDTPLAITQPLRGKMIVKVSEPELEYTGNFGWINGDANGWDIIDDTLKLSIVKFNVGVSDDSDYHVILKKFSAGKTRQEARIRAEKTKYTTSYKDSVLDLGSGYAIDKDSKYRGQKVEIEIKVPAGKRIRFDESIESKLNPFNIRIRKHRSWRRGVNIDFEEFESFPWRTNIDYIMGNDGTLKDPNGSTASQDYRYKNNDSIELNKYIEQKKQELKDLEIKKRKLDEQKSLKPTGYLPETLSAKGENFVAAAGSPVFSLTSVFN
jgi:phage shock protein PspC (stress-responsive transcriptional regulator)